MLVGCGGLREPPWLEAGMLTFPLSQPLLWRVFGPDACERELSVLSSKQVEAFHRDGFLVLPRVGGADLCNQLVELTKGWLAAQQQPLEYEADVDYPGSPTSRAAEGGLTVRRLRQAYARHPLLQQWATGAQLAQPLRQLLGDPVLLVQAHHNCIMTKQPAYSSATGWHRDIRYWSYQRPELISAWLALGDETLENGCLWVVPGSHLLPISAERFDQRLFLLPEHPANIPLLQQAQAVPLSAGDVLLFHANLFHAAGRNHTRQSKYSLVFTYRNAGNLPLADSRSAEQADIPLS